VHFLHLAGGPPVYPPLDSLGAIAYTAFFIAVTLLTMRRPAFGACVLIAVVPFALYQQVLGTTLTLSKAALLGVLLGLCAYRDAFAPIAERLPWRILSAGLLVLCAMLFSFVHAAHPQLVIREALKAAEYVLIFAAVETVPELEIFKILSLPPSQIYKLPPGPLFTHEGPANLSITVVSTPPALIRRTRLFPVSAK